MTAKLEKTVLAGTINLGDYSNFRFEFDVVLENGTVEEYVEGCGIAAKCLLVQAASSTNPIFQEKVREYVAATFGITSHQVPIVPPAGQPAMTQPEAPAVRQPAGPFAAAAPAPAPSAPQGTAKVPPTPAPATTPAPASSPSTAPSLAPGMQVVAKCPGVKGQACGADVTKSQKDLSMLVCSKPLCKACMAKVAGVT